MSDGDPLAPKRPPSKRRSKGETVDRLVDSAISTLRTQGITGTSARTVAAAADVNQALIFYHFDGMEGLLAEACRRTTQRRVDQYRDRFAAVGSLRELLEVGRELHVTEQAEGNVAVLAQLLAAGQTDPALGRVTADALDQWVAEVEAVAGPGHAGLPAGGRGRCGRVEPGRVRCLHRAGALRRRRSRGRQQRARRLEQLGVLVEVVDELGPLARRAVRSRIRRTRN